MDGFNIYDASLCLLKLPMTLPPCTWKVFISSSWTFLCGDGEVGNIATWWFCWTANTVVQACCDKSKTENGQKGALNGYIYIYIFLHRMNQILTKCSNSSC